MKHLNRSLICLFILLAILFNNFSCSFRTVEDDNYKWQLTFEDEFDSFDRSKWITLHDNGNRTIWSNNESQWYVDDNVFAENGILKLVAKKQTIYGKDVESEKEFNFTSGMICNSKSFVQPYGKWEMKCRFPFRKGFWPAFFLVPVQRPTLPEIDIFEYFGIDSNKISSGHIWGIDYPNSTGSVYEGSTEPFYYSKTKITEGNFSDTWMVWSFECFPNEMSWKLNGNVVMQSTQGIPTAPMYMIANVAIKDRPENNVKIDASDLPYIMEIDYVRVYRIIPK